MYICENYQIASTKRYYNASYSLIFDNRFNMHEFISDIIDINYLSLSVIFANWPG